MPEILAYSQLLPEIPKTFQPLLRLLPRDDPDLLEHILDVYAREELQRLNEELRERKRVLEEKLAELHERLKELEMLKARLEAKRRRLEDERTTLQGRISSLEGILDVHHGTRAASIHQQRLSQLNLIVLDGNDTDLETADSPQNDKEDDDDVELE